MCVCPYKNVWIFRMEFHLKRREFLHRFMISSWPFKDLITHHVYVYDNDVYYYGAKTWMNEMSITVKVFFFRSVWVFHFGCVLSSFSVSIFRYSLWYICFFAKVHWILLLSFSHFFSVVVALKTNKLIIPMFSVWAFQNVSVCFVMPFTTFVHNTILR